MYGKFFIHNPLNMVTNMEESRWLNVRNAVAKLLAQGKHGRWRVARTEVAKELS